MRPYRGVAVKRRCLACRLHAGYLLMHDGSSSYHTRARTAARLSRLRFSGVNSYIFRIIPNNHRFLGATTA
jgi:hypothetical protein